MALILAALVVSSCATMRQNSKQAEEFKSLMKSGIITVSDLQRLNRGEYISSISVLVEGKQVDMVKWRIRNYPAVNTDSYLTFINGKCSKVHVIKHKQQQYLPRRHR